MSDGNAVELYRKYRPKSFKQVVGQPEAVKQLRKGLNAGTLPHTLAFVGPSGTGKTTLARILAGKLNCVALFEINAAESRGIDTVRDAREKQGLAVPEGGCRVWIWDECHKLTGDAQTAMLKMIEDTYSHCYHFLCTTDPRKLQPTILSRCTEIKLKPVTAKELHTLLRYVLDCEGVPVGDGGFSEKSVGQIVELAEGSARKALVLLHQVLGLESEEEQLAVLQKQDAKRQAIELARAIISPKADWLKVAAIIDGIDEDPESVRRLVLAYCWAILKKGGPMANRADLLIDTFKAPMFETGTPGKAVLGSACYYVCTKKG